ncbi:bacterial group 3 Ig-like protein, partial [Acinetobacter pittii]
VAGTDGSWSVPNPGNLVDGDTVTATATDPAGNISLPGTGQSLQTSQHLWLHLMMC